MGAIKPHKTDVDKSGSWDGPKAVADAPNDRKVLRYMHAWVDENGDPDAKQSYKFPHHRPNVGSPAVIAAVNNALARLPNVKIPEADKAAVERHLRKHRQDAGLEEDALALSMVERRTFQITELRVKPGDDDHPQIDGYAAVFNQMSEDLGGFREKILPGAFANSIRTDDIRALLNHDPNYVLGRNTAGTLRLAEDEHGLKIEIDLPDTQYARDLVAVMNRGDIDQMSFGFRTITDNWRKENDLLIRELIDVQLFDVSAVTYPAYPQTVAHARDILNAHQADAGELSQEDGEPEGQELQGGDGAQERPDYDLERKRLDLLNKL